MTELRVSVLNHDPNAKCASASVSATDDTSANGGLGSAAANQFATGGVVGSTARGVCTSGAPISFYNGSFDPDVEEGDAISSTSVVCFPIDCQET